MNLRNIFKKQFYLLLFFLFVGFLHAQNKNTLDYYLNISKQNNPNLQDLTNQMSITALDSIKMRREFGFKVNGIADASYSPQFNNWGYNGNSTINGNNLALLGRVSRDFISKKNYDAKLNSFSIGIQQLLNQKNLSALNLKKAITEQYLLTYESQEQKKIDQEIIDIFRQEDLILKKLTQSSVFRQTDYLSFKVGLQQILLQQKQHEADYQNNFALLQYLSGSSEEIESLKAPDFKLSEENNFGQSIYAQSFRTDSLKLANDIQLINYSYQPKISLFADGGYSSALLQTPYKNFGISAGVSLNIPIYDGHQRELLLAQKKIELDTKKNYEDFYQKQYLQYQKQIENQIQQYKGMSAIAHQQLEYAKTLIVANLKQLPTGDVKMVDFLLSITNYTTLKSGILQYKMQLLRLENQRALIILP